VYLASQLVQIPGIKVLKLPAYASTATFHIFVLRFDEQAFGIARQAFIEALEAEGVPCLSGYAFPLYKNPLFLNQEFYPSQNLGNARGPIADVNYAEFEELCPASEAACNEAVWLEQRLLLGTQDDMNDVVGAIEKIWQYRSHLKPKEVVHRS
jgi:perosamine synthetase